MARLVLIYGHLKAWDTMRVDYVDTISRFNSEHNWEGLCDHLKKLRIFTLTSSNFLHLNFDSET